MPVISNLVFTKTASTIVATWDTDTSSDSNLSAGGKAAIDNGVAANQTTGHQCIVVGLLPSTVYSCFVTSGGTSSSPQNVTTNALNTRILVTSASNGAVTLGSQTNNLSDTQRTFLSNDNKVYVTQDDGKGIVVGTPNAGFNTQVAALSDEVAMTGGATLLNTYGGLAALSGTDGPAGAAMTNKSTGLFGLNGNLHMFVYRQHPPTYDTNRYANWIKSTNHGSTWNNFTAPSTFVAGGNPVTPYSPAEPVQFYSNLIGLVTPVLYAADDGTLGYNTAGNQIDGGNAYVYMHYFQDTTPLFLMRLPRIQFDAQNAAPMQYWKGSSAFPSPLDFTNDSNWSSTPGDAVNIMPANNGNFGPFNPGIVGAWVQMAFVPAINSYVMTTWGTYNGGLTTEFIFYSSPTPAGPWQIFFTQANYTLSKNWYGPFLFHRDIAANVATSAITSKFLYAGNAGASFYQINYSTLTMLPASVSDATMTQQAFYGFTTVENPLSNGGKFTTCPTMSALQVLSSGVCEATVISTHCGAYWSAPIPASDTGGTWPADQYSEVTISSDYIADSTGYFIPLVRQSAAANTQYRAFIIVGASNSLFQAVVAGTPHTLSTFTVTPAANDVWRFTVVGNVLTLTQNGTQRATFTDTSNFVTAGAPGLDLFAATLTKEKAFSWAAGANQAAAPTFSPIGGSYSTQQTVTITGPATSTIYYTTDGTTPTRSSASIATGGTVSITSSKTLKAIASVSNFVDSQISGATFSITGANPGTTITITMRDNTTVVSTVPPMMTATAYISLLRESGGIWDNPPDPATPANWWPYRYWKKAVTS